MRLQNINTIGVPKRIKSIGERVPQNINWTKKTIDRGKCTKNWIKSIGERIPKIS